MSIEIDLQGPDGNMFNLLGIALTWNRQLGRKVDLMKRVKKNHPRGGYEDLLDEFDKMFKHIDYTFVNDPRDPRTHEDDE